MALTPLPFVPAGPAGPVAPVAPVGPVAPAGPRGIVKLRTAAELVPEFVTTADVPDTPVVVVPTLTVEEEPARARTAQTPTCAQQSALRCGAKIPVNERLGGLATSESVPMLGK